MVCSPESQGKISKGIYVRGQGLEIKLTEKELMVLGMCLQSCGVKFLNSVLCGMIHVVGFPWLDSSVGWSVIPMCQRCGLDPWPKHIQESTNECINK